MSFIIVLEDGSTYSAFNAEEIRIVEVSEKGDELLNEGYEPDQLGPENVIQVEPLSRFLNKRAKSFFIKR